MAKAGLPTKGEGTHTIRRAVARAFFDGIDDGSENMCQAVFDDGAEFPIQNAASTQAPFTGSWIPDEPLSTFIA
jgi:hypothetical protein